MPILKFKIFEIYTDITNDIDKIVPKNFKESLACITSILIVFFFKLKMKG
jgi:hypothetical protein